MSHRPLAIVTGLMIGDYLLWNWSLNANHDVLALVSGLSLPPMTIAFLSLVALTAARLIARTSRASARNPRADSSELGAASKARPQGGPAASPTPTGPSRKIAA